jgi:hypothetical protein
MPPDPPATSLAAQAGAEIAAYTEAMHELLLPLMRILIAKGIGYPQLDALVQRAYVEAAERWFVGDGERPTASRLYMLTGIHRKKIEPIRAAPRPLKRSQRSLGSLVMDRITSDPALLDRRGHPKALEFARRTGGARSFEALVEEVSKDVRPRALLDEWLRSGHAVMLDDGRVQVRPVGKALRAPRGDEVQALQRMLVPAAQTVAQAVLCTGIPSGYVKIDVGGLSADAVRELSKEAQRRLAAVLVDMNRKAERLARAQARRGDPGPHVFHAGVFDWAAGFDAAAAASSQQRPAEPPTLLAARARRKAEDRAQVKGEPAANAAGQAGGRAVPRRGRVRPSDPPS